MVRAVGGAKIHSNWSASAGQLIFTRDNASVGVTWGEDGSGIDTTWFGETAGVKMQWIVSSDQLYTNSTAKVNFAGDVAIASASFSSNIIVTKEADITSASVTTLTTVSLSVTGPATLTSASFTGGVVHAASNNITLGANANVVLSSASGSMFGTTSTQKIGFLGAAPIVAEKFSISAADLASAMRNFGLMTTTSA